MQRRYKIPLILIFSLLAVLLTWQRYKVLTLEENAAMSLKSFQQQLEYKEIQISILREEIRILQQ